MSLVLSLVSLSTPCLSQCEEVTGVVAYCPGDAVENPILSCHMYFPHSEVILSPKPQALELKPGNASTITGWQC